MALFKKIKQKNGLELSYHRIALINVDVHNHVTVLVYSYSNQEARLMEKEILNSNENKINELPYMLANYYNYDFDEIPELLNGNVIQEAYNILKKLPDYEGATNILEKGQIIE